MQWSRTVRALFFTRATGAVRHPIVIVVIGVLFSLVAPLLRSGGRVQREARLRVHAANSLAFLRSAAMTSVGWFRGVTTASSPNPAS